jgi:hypothetical protein
MPNFQASAQILFNIRLRPILLRSAASFIIWYPNVPCFWFWFSDTDIKQTARRIVWEEMCSSDKLHSLRSLLQALHTKYRHLYSLYVHFTHQRTERYLAFHTSVMTEIVVT